MPVGALSRRKCRFGLYDFGYGSSNEGPAAAATRKVVPGVSIGDVNQKGSTRFNLMKIYTRLVSLLSVIKIISDLQNKKKKKRQKKRGSQRLRKLDI